MKTRIILIYFLLISMVSPFVLPSIVSASVTAPNSEFSIDYIREYRNALEQDDLFILVNYSIIYSSGTPTDYTANDLFTLRMFDGATYVNSDNPYSFGSTNDYGFNTGVIGFYYSASDASNLGLTWGDTYTFVLSGNPLISWNTGTPPSTSKTGADVSFDGNNLSSIDTQVRLIVGNIAQDFEDDWELDAGTLVDMSSGKAVLTTYGETYFNTSIPNLDDISPSLYGVSTISLDYTYPRSNILSYCSGTRPSGTYAIYQNVGLAKYNQVSVSFVPNHTGLVRDVTMLFGRVGNGSGTMSFTIYNSVSGSFTGTALCHGVIDTSDFVIYPLRDWYTATMGTPAKVIAGNEYTVVVYSGSGNNLNYTQSLWMRWSDCPNNTSYKTTNAWATKSLTVIGGLTYKLGLIVTEYNTSYSDEIAEDANSDGLFKLDPISDTFGVSRMFMGVILGACFIFFLMKQSRDSSGTTNNAFIVAVFALIGLSLLLPIGTTIIAVFTLLMAIVTAYILFFRGSSA